MRITLLIILFGCFCGLGFAQQNEAATLEDYTDLNISFMSGTNNHHIYVGIISNELREFKVDGVVVKRGGGDQEIAPGGSSLLRQISLKYDRPDYRDRITLRYLGDQDTQRTRITNADKENLMGQLISVNNELEEYIRLVEAQRKTIMFLRSSSPIFGDGSFVMLPWEDSGKNKIGIDYSPEDLRLRLDYTFGIASTESFYDVNRKCFVVVFNRVLNKHEKFDWFPIYKVYIDKGKEFIIESGTVDLKNGIFRPNVFGKG